MHWKPLALAAASLFFTWSYAMPQPPVTRPTRANVLKTLDASHPRLILKDADLAKLKQLIRKDPLLKKGVDAMLKRADRYARRHTITRKLRGPRLLHVSRDCMNRMYTLGLAWRLTGEKKYLNAARRNLLAACAFKDWNPSHFLDTAEMSHAVGIGYDWFFHALTEEERKTIRDGLIEHGLKPGLKAYGYSGKPPRWSWWTGSVHNWNQVCNGGLIAGALAIAETEADYAKKIVPAAVRLLPKALVNYAPEGAWMEGPGYWKYATDYTVYALASLETALGTDFGLGKMKGVSETGWYPIYMTGPTGLPFNFADAGKKNRPRGSAPCMFWLAKRYNEPAFAADERAMMTKRPGDPFDVIWYVPGGRRPKRPTLDRCYRGRVDVAFFRGSWDDGDALYFAVKAGFNQVNHAHCDVGSFVMDALGVRWAVDLGADDYNLPSYWGRAQESKRWSYYRLSALSHNVPLLNNRNQDVDAVTKVDRFKSTRRRAFAVIDLTSAYKRLAKKVTRGVALIDHRAALVQDEFTLDKPVEVAWGMATEAKITLDGARATLTQNDKTLHAEILSPEGAVFTKESAEQKPPQATNRGVRRLMIRLAKQEGSVTVAVLLSPAWPKAKTRKHVTVTPVSKW